MRPCAFVPPLTAALMQSNDIKGLGVSVGVHLLLALVLSIIIGSAPPDEPPVRLVELEMGPITAPRSAARPSAQAPRPNPQPPQPEPTPDRPRPTPPTATPVQAPRVQTPPATERPIPQPRQEPEASPRPPAPPQPDPAPPQTSGGTPTGSTGQTSNPESNTGSGNTGTSGLSIEGLGSRGATCPRPSYPGVNGTVAYAVTFGPDGRYVASRPVRRGGDARIDQAVRSVIAGCRAEGLPGAADQVNQEGRVTFVFRGR